MTVLKSIPIILFSITICSHALAVEPRTKSDVQVEGGEGTIKGPWWQVSTKDANTGLVIKRKVSPVGTPYFMKPGDQLFVP